MNRFVVKSFFFQKGKKPWARAMEKTCIDRFGECFLKCKKGNLRCLSFAVGYVSECPSGIQCLLYSEAFLYQRLLSRDDQYSYHVPVSITTLPYFLQ